MKRKLLMFATMILSVVIALGVSACGEKPGPEPEPPTVTLSESSLALDKYASATLVATTAGEAEGGVTWLSSDETIASVKDGTVIALQAGTATITASYGTASATCSVTVSDAAGKTPTLKFTKTMTQIFVDGKYSIEPKISFDGTDYTDGSFAFVSSDPTVASVGEDGVVTGIKYGTATITVMAGWRGAGADILTGEVTVKVVPDVVAEITDEDGAKQSAYTIYTLDSLEGVDFGKAVTLKANVLENRAASSAVPTWTIADGGEDLITVTNGVIESKGVAGETTVKISVTVAGAQFESAPVTIKIDRPAVEKSVSKDVDLSLGTIDGTFNPFESDEIVDIVDVTDIADQVDLGYNAEDGTFDGSAIKAGERKWRVYNDTFGYEIDVVAASIIVKTPQDFVKMYEVTNKSIWTYEGYIVLDSDLDFAGFDYAAAKAASAWWSPRVTASSVGFFINTPNGNADEKAPSGVPGVQASPTRWLTNGDGFFGTFDGRGHVISNLSIELYGLFPCIAEGSTFKNVAFVNADVVTVSATIASAVKGRVENVYIELNADNTWGQIGIIGGVTSALGSTATLKNVVACVNFTDPNRMLTAERGGNENHKTIEECGIIASAYQTGATLTDVYAIGNGTPFSSYIANVGGDAYDGGITASATLAKANFTDLSGFDTAYWDVTGGIPQWKGSFVTASVSDVVIGAIAPITLSTNSRNVTFTIADVPSKIASYVSLSGSTVTIDEGIASAMDAGEILTVTVGAKFGDADKIISTTSFRITKPHATATVTAVVKGSGEAAFATSGVTDAAGSVVTVIAGGVKVNGTTLAPSAYALSVKADSSANKYFSFVPTAALGTGDTVTLVPGSVLKIGEIYYITAGDVTQIKVDNGTGYASGDYCELKSVSIDKRGSWGSSNQVRIRHDDLGLSDTSGKIISGRVLKNGETFTNFASLGYFADTANSIYGTFINFAFAAYDKVSIEPGLTIQYGDACYRFDENYSLVNVPAVSGAAYAGGNVGYGGGNWAEPWDLTGEPMWGSATNVQFASSAIESADNAIVDDVWKHSDSTNVYSDWVTVGDITTTGVAVMLTREGTTTGLGRGTDYRIRFTTNGTTHSLYVLAWDYNPFQMGDIVTIKKGTVVIYKIDGVDRYFVVTSTRSQKYTGKGIWGGAWENCETPASLAD